jgi:D-lactate dehydrogenase
MSKNIAFFGTKPWEKEHIEKQQSKLADAALWFTEEIVSDDHPPKETDFEAISVFVDSNVTKAVLDKLPILKFIATRSTGFDHIDMAACKERGIQVSSVTSYGAINVD